MKRFYPIFLAAMLTLAACAQSSQPSASVAPPAPAPSSEATVTPLSESSEADPSAETQEEPRLTVADAALYRGTVTSIEETPEGKKLVLEQAKGTNFGSAQHTFVVTENTRLSFADELLTTGAYLEIYYGVPMGQAPDPNEISQAIAINRYHEAAMVVFNGTLRSIEKDADGKGSLTLIEMGTEQEVIFHFDESTSFYLNVDELKEGDTLNLLHSGAYTMSIPPQGAALEVRRYYAGN